MLTTKTENRISNKIAMKKFHKNLLFGMECRFKWIFVQGANYIFSWSGDDSLAKLYRYLNQLGKEYTNENWKKSVQCSCRHCPYGGSSYFHWSYVVKAWGYPLKA